MATVSDSPEATTPPAGPEAWRDLEAWMETPEFREMMERDYPESAKEWTDPVTRRNFLTLMGASVALAGSSGCLSPRAAPNRKIHAYTRKPEQITPGVPIFFASAIPLNGVGTGVLVRSHEGRPIKVEGNPSHPSSLGGTDTLTQAAVLNLFDPDRLQMVTELGQSRSWDTAIDRLRQLYQAQVAKKGAGLRILTDTVTSPTLAAMLEAVLKDCPEGKWVQYDPAGQDSVRAGAKLAFDKYVTPVYDFTKADVVVTLDADFMASGPGSARYARDFSSRRKVRVDKKDGGKATEMNRLYAIETIITPTGTLADHRLAVKPSEVESFARALASELKVDSAPPAGPMPELAKKWLAPLAKDLQDHKGKCLVVAGCEQPPAVHALAHAINAHLDNIGTTVTYHEPIEAKPTDQVAELKELTADLNAGKVELLFLLNVNPVFTAPSDLKFAEALAKAGMRIFLGQSLDETAVACQWILPESHPLEAWGDIRGHDGTVTIQQPLIAPLYQSRSALELFAALLQSDSQTGQDIVRATWQSWFKDQNKDGDFESFWQESLQEGLVAGTAKPKTDVKPVGSWADNLDKAPGVTQLEVALRPDPSLFDGRFANNGWLQELPRPVTQITWDNVIHISPKTAEELGIARPKPRWTGGEHGNAGVPEVTVTIGDRMVTGAAWTMPGHADGAVTIHYGHGRTHAGRVGNGTGFNAYPLRTTGAMNLATGAKVELTGKTLTVACTQMHYATENRKPVRPMTVSEYQKPEERSAIIAPPVAAAEKKEIFELVPGPDEYQFGRNGSKEHHDHDHHHEQDHHHEHEHDSRLTPLTLYPPTSKENRRWAMVIDTSVCFGCNSCVAACVSENNIPVVGKDQVTRGRVMHWIRIDRYHVVNSPDRKVDQVNEAVLSAEATELQTFMQPLPCQQCEKAPCELVCPVAATVHSADGLNDMVYNRCVGTRYCSNNCPYKVRRFNFLFYADYVTESLKLGRNPDVTVRTRGVMEKCTYCVQRIRAAEIEAEREWATRPNRRLGPLLPDGTLQERPMIADGEVVTACQAACPSNAIMFGDLADPTSVVNRWRSEPTNYGLLAELNTMPRTTYLAAVRNPNPNMPKGV